MRILIPILVVLFLSLPAFAEDAFHKVYGDDYYSLSPLSNNQYPTSDTIREQERRAYEYEQLKALRKIQRALEYNPNAGIVNTGR